jgi:hypothetical protein
MPIYLDRIWRIIAAVVGVVLFAAAAARAQETAADATSAAKPSNTITGRVVSQGGEAVSGAAAFVSVIGPVAQGRSAMVDSNGSFKFEGLEPGVYFVSASLAGFVSAPPSPDEPRRYYHPGESVTVNLIKGGVITGTVNTATNGPVVAAAVRAFRIKDVNGQPESAVVQARERQTDDRGVYRFYGLPPGTYVISAGGQNRSYG